MQELDVIKVKKKHQSNKRKILSCLNKWKTSNFFGLFFATEIWDSLLDCTLKLWSTLLDGWLCKSLKKPQLTYGTSWGTKELLTGKTRGSILLFFIILSMDLQTQNMLHANEISEKHSQWWCQNMLQRTDYMYSTLVTEGQN